MRIFIDNISDTLIQIYYDELQIADRTLFFESSPDLCEKFADQNYYYKYLCVNDYFALANQIKDEINFNSEDILN